MENPTKGANDNIKRVTLVGNVTKLRTLAGQKIQKCVLFSGHQTSFHPSYGTGE